MKLTISEANKKQFISMFQMLKNVSNMIQMNMNEDKIHIQGMDKTHVCLFDLTMDEKWFDEYVNDKQLIANFDTNIFYNIISYNQDNSNLIIKYSDKDEDNMHIDIIYDEKTLSNFDKHFKLPLVEFDNELFKLPEIEYDAEFTIPSKTICDVVSQMAFFGDNLNIKCSEDAVHILTNGISGEMLVDIPINELNEYSVVEDEEITLTYSLNYISKMCITNKLSSDIEFSLSREFPMKIKYDLGEESCLVFYIAPKMKDD
jgi:proliferating cell nuclear antigen PCNA